LRSRGSNLVDRGREVRIWSPWSRGSNLVDAGRSSSREVGSDRIRSREVGRVRSRSSGSNLVDGGRSRRSNLVEGSRSGSIEVERFESGRRWSIEEVESGRRWSIEEVESGRGRSNLVEFDGGRVKSREVESSRRRGASRFKLRARGRASSFELRGSNLVGEVGRREIITLTVKVMRSSSALAARGRDFGTGTLGESGCTVATVSRRAPLELVRAMCAGSKARFAARKVTAIRGRPTRSAREPATSSAYTSSAHTS
jgi:hypothetical protein